MPKKHVYREGDKVRIVRPDFVDRVGYAFDPAAEAGRIIRDHEDDIARLLHAIDPEHIPAPVAMLAARPPGTPAARLGAFVGVEQGHNHQYWDIAMKLAFHVGAYRKLGGPERKLWTTPRPEFAGVVMHVGGKRTVGTGIYYPPGGGYSYDGDYDYEPGGLSHRRNHVLLDVYDVSFFRAGKLEIDAANVEPA